MSGFLLLKNQSKVVSSLTQPLTKHTY